MSKIIFVSNRLPVTVSKNEETIEYSKSIGGLATGLKSYHEQSGSIWVGWPGLSYDSANENERVNIQEELKDSYNCLPVFLTDEEINKYYYGFSNKTIWPLFHYFSNKTEYDPKTWKAYCDVNRKFFAAVDPIVEENDIIWIHDYQLMLLPQMIKEKHPNVKIGFFLHIPFPSFEIFRLLIWREEILKGLLGADLIGFHTYDYVRHFLSSARRILGLEHNLNDISYEDRHVRVDVFPMGIDYERFSREYYDESFQKEFKEIADTIKGTKLILSIDRLDYTKGIPERIKAFGRFLSKYPEYIGKVRLNLIVAPSRVEVDSYNELKREIEKLVSQVNGKYGTYSWMPIWFFYQSFTQESLIAFYKNSDVLLVSPLRDGMNLVVKEYIAARTDYEGMVVISETAGAASELGEAVVVNPNDFEAIADGIKVALDMTREERIEINRIMHKRLKRYNVDFWASEFINSLKNISINTMDTALPKEVDKDASRIEEAYRKAKRRVFFLDYDGTLVGFKPVPNMAKPDEDLKALLAKLAEDPKNTVVIISGRDRHTLDEWLGDLNLHTIAAHGLWVRRPDKDWMMTAILQNDWKKYIHHILELYADRMPGALIEEKDYSLAFHYRQCDPDMAAVKLSEIRESLMSMIRSMSLSIQEGNKVIEIKDSRVNKGQGASLFLQNKKFDFILGAGDDYTDEDIFSSLPEGSYTIKVGPGNTHANYRVKSLEHMRSMLEKFTDISGKNKTEGNSYGKERINVSTKKSKTG